MHDVPAVPVVRIFEISFYWAEADDAGGFGALRADRTMTPFLRCMSGTSQRQETAAHLSGDIGDAVHCTIYENRPSPCRRILAMSGENGEETCCLQPGAGAPRPATIAASLQRYTCLTTGAESATTERFAVQSPAS